MVIQNKDMKFKFIKKYLTLFLSFSAFILLVLGFTLFSYIYSIKTQANNNILNALGEEKTLSQKISKDILLIDKDWKQSRYINSVAFRDLYQESHQFNDIINSLHEGGIVTNSQFSYPVPGLGEEFENNFKDIENSWSPLRKQIELLNGIYLETLNIANSNHLNPHLSERKISIFTIKNDNEKKSFPDDMIDENGKLDSKSSVLLKNHVFEKINENINNEINQTNLIFTSNNLNLLFNLEKINNRFNDIIAQRDNLLCHLQNAMIFLCFFFFFVISFYIFKRLVSMDIKANSDESEKSAILNNIKEGLFLMNDKWIIETKGSSYLNEIFNSSMQTPCSFHEILKKMVSNEILKQTENFVDIIFNKDLEESALPQLNPLKLISVEQPNGKKYLSINFIKVFHNNTQKVLVTILDSTQQHFLEENLKKEKLKNKQQLDMLANISQHNNKEKLENLIILAKQNLIRNNEFIKKESFNTKEPYFLIKQVKESFVNFLSNDRENEFEMINSLISELIDFLLLLEKQSLITSEEFSLISSKIHNILETLDFIDQIIK